eukprot:4024008-Pleurochrysis_carterae.AAC.1
MHARTHGEHDAQICALARALLHTHGRSRKWTGANNAQARRGVRQRFAAGNERERESRGRASFTVRGRASFTVKREDELHRQREGKLHRQREWASSYERSTSKETGTKSESETEHKETLCFIAGQHLHPYQAPIKARSLASYGALLAGAAVQPRGRDRLARRGGAAARRRTGAVVR